ncbi:G-type lectin S-receptor-like serine/threonine-protein kinase CES101 isoform X3 [Castanea sativa]|uniref:G-type lectin S-receptor-like serine/threonine-protein kinase CES101 isoform X3 n=1 Tax=Castanea sativa TaxID=21020 RepID=UPI003F652CFE
MCTTMDSKERLLNPTLLLIIIISSLWGSSAASETLTQGDVLNSPQYLVSAKQRFTLGFFSPTSYDGDKKNSYLGIWYTNYTENIVWIANRNRPISDDSIAFLTLDHLGKLMINSSGFGGDPFVIYSGGETENTSATLLDTGNLVVSEVNSNGSIGRSLWESFDDPTDTLLPGMKLGLNHKTGRNWSLISWLAEDDPASGAFTLEWEPKTRRLVIKRRGVPYWSSGLQLSSSKNVSLFDYIHPTKGQDYIINTDAEGQYFTYSLDTEFDLLDQERSAWQLKYWGPIMDRSILIMKMNFCYGYGMDDEGCETWNQPECRLMGRQTFEQKSGIFTRMGPDGLPQLAAGVFDNRPTIGPADCRDLCWNNCDCLGYSGKEGIGSGCQFWEGNVTFNPDDGRSRSRILKYVLTKEDPSNKATDNFSAESKLGEGGFGPVYKGALPEGREIAVKRLSRNSGQGLVEFKNELILIAKLQHMNLVKLLGCCFQGEEKMLIYEFMPNKSLDSFLFDPTKSYLLDWKIRVNIIEGIAQGLLYLHKYSRLKVIHRDLKASNILLDENMCAKISDFGMARIFKRDGLEANTNRIVGTYGYMSPEYAMEGIFSEKSDVFSFGVLMLEIVSGRKNNNFYNVNGPLNLVGYAWDLWQRGSGKDIMDPTLKDSCPMHQLLRFIHVALSCLEDSAADRPTILEVISMLKNETMPLPILKKPAFFMGSNVNNEDLQRKESKNYSVNGLSISRIDAR